MFDRIEISELKERLWNLASDKSITVYEIETFLRNVIKRKPLPLVEIAFESYCRCSLNSKEEIFKTVSRCSYNPNLDSIKLQRCNYEKQQVFYAAVPVQAEIKCHGTAILETSWEHIANHYLDYYFMTLSRWTTRRSLNVFFFPDLELIHAKREGVDVEKDMLETGGINPKDVSYYLSVLKLFREIFSEKKDKDIWYRVSSAFYNCIMRFGKENQINLDGMVYSSANTQKIGANIVLETGLIKTDTIYCDYVQMWIGRKNSNDPTDIWMEPVSDGVIPNSDGQFELSIWPKYLELFKNAPSLDIRAIVNQ